MMKTLRKYALQATFAALCTTALSAIPAMAQDPSTPPPAQDQMGGRHGGGDPSEREARQLKMMTKKLNLTPDQVTQVKAINDDTHTQMMALRSDTSTPQADKRAKMMSIREASQDKIRGVLTDDQKTKFDAMRAQMKERREERQGAPAAAPATPPQV